MPNTKTPKNHAKHERPAASRHKQQEETVDLLLRGLDALAAHAEGEDMCMAARIFYTAKEELVHWAVTMNFHESPQDRFINRRLYDNRLSTVEALVIRAIKQDTGARIEMMNLLGLPIPKQPVLPAGALERADRRRYLSERGKID